MIAKLVSFSDPNSLVDGTALTVLCFSSMTNHAFTKTEMYSVRTRAHGFCVCVTKKRTKIILESTKKYVIVN